MRLTHPETNPPPHSWSVEKLASMKPVPGAKKVGDRRLKLLAMYSHVSERSYT